MFVTNSLTKIISATLLAFTLLIFGANAHAASCKGKAKSVCSSASDCYWVDSYKRKDGINVSSHCRTKAGKSDSMKKAKSSSSEKAKKAKMKMNKKANPKSKSGKKMKAAEDNIDKKKKKTKKPKKDKKS